MSPKKKNTAIADTGDIKISRRRSKCIANNTSKTYNGVDVKLLSEEKLIKEEKQANRVIKRRRKKVLNNELEIVQAESDSKIMNRCDTSDTDQPAAKKKRIAMKSKALMKKKNYQVKSRSKKRSKISTINSKITSGNNKIVRTVVNDYISDEITPDNVKSRSRKGAKVSTVNSKITSGNNKIVRTVVNDYIANELTPHNDKELMIKNFISCQKIPIIKLNKIDLNEKMGNVSIKREHHDDGDCKTSNSITDSLYSLNNSTSPSILLSDTMLPIIENKETSFDKLSVLDLCELKLNKYTGYEPDINIDLSEKKLNLIIQNHELKITKWGGITSDPSYGDIKTAQISTSAHSKTCNINEEQCRTEENIKSIVHDKERSYRFTCTNDDDDDDDVLSLFAESLSGIETNSKNPQTLPIIEDKGTENKVFKVPKLVLPNPFKVKNRLGYKVCEKQNADSTSFQTEYANPEKSLANSFFSMKLTKSRALDSNLMESLHQPVSLVKSCVFKGICIFNIIKKCKNISCNFPHLIPCTTYISEKLLKLTNHHFIQEYLMVRNTIELLRFYGLAYVNDCVRRQMPRILIEMAWDFATKFGSDNNLHEDNKLKIKAMEHMLLYFNEVELHKVTDLLNMKIKSDVLLCDEFLEVIGQSQNFSRFKTVFLNLTNFMCSQNRTFNSDVVSQILERVSILPYSFDLARALIDIMRRTNIVIISNTMIELFAKKLSESNEDLFREFTYLMKSADLTSHSSSSSTMENGEKHLQLIDNDIRYSPDTTNNENLDKQNVPGPSGLQLRQTQQQYRRRKHSHIRLVQYRSSFPNSLPIYTHPFNAREFRYNVPRKRRP